MLAGAGGLALELLQPRADLLDEEVDALQVLSRGREAVAGFVQAGAQEAHVRGFFEQPATLLGAHHQHLFDETLAHEGVAVLADLGAQEEVQHVAQTHLRLVDQVLALAVAVGAAADDDLGVIERQPAGLRCRG